MALGVSCVALSVGAALVSRPKVNVGMQEGVQSLVGSVEFVTSFAVRLAGGCVCVCVCVRVCVCVYVCAICLSVCLLIVYVFHAWVIRTLVLSSCSFCLVSFPPGH